MKMLQQNSSKNMIKVNNQSYKLNNNYKIIVKIKKKNKKISKSIN